MANNFPSMNLKEFKSAGFLQEANRQFFHPLGLALFVSYDEHEHNDDSEPVGLGIMDYRDDPEGMIFAELTEADKERAAKIADLRESKREARLRLLGDIIQPLDE